MSLHKLTAGSGYDYLTRQVARQDATGQGHTGLADYYTAQGEAPGRWMGAGLAGLDGLDAGDTVTAEQMRLLFGSGHHPLATDRLEALGPDATEAQRRTAVRLGTPFKVYSPTEDVTLFRREVARRFEEHNVAAGLPRDHPIDIDDRARIRTEVARSLFRAEHGRDPANAREISATIAKHSRPRTSAVAGYDLTFTPAKSVSALWAVAPPTIRHQIEAAHDDAVADALAYLERNALVHPHRQQRGAPGRGTRCDRDWRSSTGTPAPGTRTCTPTWRWPTRCRPWTGGGCRSTGGSCTRPR